MIKFNLKSAKIILFLIAASIITIFAIAASLFPYTSTGISGLKDDNLSISTLNGQDISVRLFPTKEEITLVTNGTEDCGSSVGDKHFIGTYYLKTFIEDKERDSLKILFDDGRRKKGVLVFTDGDRVHNGIHHIKFSGITDSFIGVYQYASCRDTFVRLYRVDEHGNIIPVLFNRVNEPSTPLEMTNALGTITVEDGLVKFCTWSPWENSCGTSCDVFEYKNGNFDFLRTDRFDEQLI